MHNTLTQISLLLQEILQRINFTKDVLTLEEAALYIGVSVATLRHYTSECRIKHYKPTGKMIYFRKSDIMDFLMQNPVETEGEKSAKIIKGHF